MSDTSLRSEQSSTLLPAGVLRRSEDFQTLADLATGTRFNPALQVAPQPGSLLPPGSRAWPMRRMASPARFHQAPAELPRRAESPRRDIADAMLEALRGAVAPNRPNVPAPAQPAVTPRFPRHGVRTRVLAAEAAQAAANAMGVPPAVTEAAASVMGAPSAATPAAAAPASNEPYPTAHWTPRYMPYPGHHEELWAWLQEHAGEENAVPPAHMGVIAAQPEEQTGFPFQLYSPEERFVDPNAVPTERQAFATAENIPTPFDKLNLAHRYAQTATASFPQNRGQYMNPYLHEMTEALKRTSREQEDRAVRDLDAKFARMGAHGGSRYRDAKRDLHSQFNNDLLNAQARLLNEGYKESSLAFGRDMERQLDAANVEGRLVQSGQAQNWAHIHNLMKMAELQRSEQQQVKDFQYDQWLRAQQYPFEMLNLRASLLHGMPYNMTTNRNFQYNQAPPAPSLRSGDYLNLLGNILARRS